MDKQEKVEIAAVCMNSFLRQLGCLAGCYAIYFSLYPWLSDVQRQAFAIAAALFSLWRVGLTSTKRAPSNGANLDKE